MQYDSKQPIYIQIMDDIKMKIILDEYIANMQIPSVRELAIVYEVNPNTMQRALAQLEQEGYLYTQRTAGRFVMDDSLRIQKLKEELMSQRVNQFLSDMRKFDVSDQEILNSIKERLGK